MKTPKPDFDPFVEALRGDLPSAADEARVRARLLAAGVAVTGAALSSSSAASSFGAAGSLGGGASASLASPVGAAATGAIGAAPGAAGGTLAAGAPAALVKAGFLSKVLVLPIAAKVGVATTLVVAVAVTSVPLVLEREAKAPERAAAFEGRGRVETPALEAAPAAPASEAAATSSSVTPGEVATTAPVPGTKLERAGEPGAAQTTSDGTETNAARPRRRSASVASVPAKPASEAGAARGPADRRSMPASAASDGAEGGRTEWARASSLGEETRLMEQAMVALGEDDRELARRSLEEHARRFPAGLLQRERERALARLRQADAERPSMNFSR